MSYFLDYGKNIIFFFKIINNDLMIDVMRFIYYINNEILCFIFIFL
jgi:hypothetical protein